MTVTLFHGDCLEIMQTMADKSVDAVITDPPYGISYASARRTHKEDRFQIIAGDEELNFDYLHELFRVLSEDSCCFLFCRWDTSERFRNELIQVGFDIQSQVIWDRGVHGLGDLYKQYAPMHDNCWFCTKGKYVFPNHRPKSIYRIDRLNGNDLLHPNQKPLPLMKLIIEDLTKKRGTILDPFMGSGTTGVACVQTGRNFIGIEIDKQYFDIASDRIAKAQMQPLLFQPDEPKPKQDSLLEVL